MYNIQTNIFLIFKKQIEFLSAISIFSWWNTSSKRPGHCEIRFSKLHFLLPVKHCSVPSYHDLFQPVARSKYLSKIIIINSLTKIF